MRTLRAPSPWLQVATFFGGLLVGPYAALRISRLLAPESEIVETLAIFGFADVFIGGTLLWMGLGVATVAAKAVWNLLRGRRPGPASLEADDAWWPGRQTGGSSDPKIRFWRWSCCPEPAS